ncbi:transcriptional repressor [Corynebacterium sp. TAE3-ERU12]|uniref:Fur family transcriptional regulator n=1 Tax=Corynebacterium sp. TAE3-ERU12 TaxID=2849491 RepID=UPI001C495DB2|nr:Fur family transcriptional regulator [Corynebacterium sp. TAE3-ERU12]MBV7295777.1 transcriptional repressor [Corynebacterium sp. TAE3-ERU12]
MRQQPGLKVGAASSPRIGVRSTRQRTAVIGVLQEKDNFSSARDIHSELEHRNIHVGLTTVYRTLQSLVDAGAADVLHTDNGEALYRLCSDDHHHHLVCTECGATVEISGGPVEKWARQLAAEHGYTMTGHSAEVFGECGNCQH